MNLLSEFAHFSNISWPSLYSPTVDVGFTGPPIRPGGYYLVDADDVFRFTLYWMLIFHLPFNFLAGGYAFFNFLFPPRRPKGDDTPTISMLVLTSGAGAGAGTVPPSPSWSKPPRANARRSRATFAVLVLLCFLAFSLLSSVVGAAVVGFVLVGVYQAGGFYISTWIPFLWAVIQSLIALLNIWPSVIDII